MGGECRNLATHHHHWVYLTAYLNAYAERFVLSIKSECLSKQVLLGEGHLRLAVREYVAHYNSERPHQGLDGHFVVQPANENRAGAIECRERLGGLLRFYRRQAA